MPEFRFHHLERRRVEQALPDLLEAALSEGLRIVVHARTREACDALNDKLWTYREDSFLPHGAAGDGDPASQPIFLTDADETPNGATVRVLLAPADAPRFVESGIGRVLVLFDARDDAAMAEARGAWRLLSSAKVSVSYWREGEEGEWVKGR